MMLYGTAKECQTTQTIQQGEGGFPGVINESPVAIHSGDIHRANRQQSNPMFYPHNVM